jgi:hypothetical protein
MKYGHGVAKMPRTMSDAAFDALCEAYYVDNPSGGNLHVVLDEGGTSDEILYASLSHAILNGDLVGVAIAAEMLRMDEDDRKAYEQFVTARAERRRRGEPDDPDPTFSLVPPVIRG